MFLPSTTANLPIVEINHSTTKKMIQAYEQFGDGQSVAHLGVAKIFNFSTESVGRKEFIEQKHTIPSTGEQKTVDEILNVWLY